VIEVRNTGDVPIYICDSGFLPYPPVDSTNFRYCSSPLPSVRARYIPSKGARVVSISKAALQNPLVLNPGERGKADPHHGPGAYLTKHNAGRGEAGHYRR
jgi:hypothetical protein